MFAKIKTNLQGQKNIIVKKILPVTPKRTQWTVSNLLHQYVWEIHPNTEGKIQCIAIFLQA